MTSYLSEWSHSPCSTSPRCDAANVRLSWSSRRPVQRRRCRCHILQHDRVISQTAHFDVPSIYPELQPTSASSQALPHGLQPSQLPRHVAVRAQDSTAGTEKATPAGASQQLTDMKFNCLHSLLWTATVAGRRHVVWQQHRGTKQASKPYEEQ